MNFWKSASGVVEVELTSAEPLSALYALNQQGISLFDTVFADDLTIRFQIPRSEYRKIKMLAHRRGETLRLAKQLGVYWILKGLKERRLLVFGAVLLVFLVFFLPTRVLFFRVEGNAAVPTGQILAAAESCGMGFGVSRREIRSEKIKNQLLYEIPQLQWVGVNTRGCVAWITVRERTNQVQRENQSGVSSIVAVRDGIVDSCTVIRGNMLCKPGQAVRNGQVLISGYTDCGLYLQATRAEGEIYAYTKREMNAVSLMERRHVTDNGHVKYRLSLLIGKKRINLWKDSGISDATCGRMYSEYYITLPGGFSLPVALAVETFHQRDEKGVQYAAPDTSMLASFARNCLLDQMVAGQIRSDVHSVSADAGIVRLRGSYICYEMIGRVQHEKIGE